MMRTILTSALLASLMASGAVFASHQLDKPKPKEAESDPHISWHQFRHEMGSYSQLNATFTHEGVLTLSGHLDDGAIKSRVELLAGRVRGATHIYSQILTD